jgi:hypothetical protein
MINIWLKINFKSDFSNQINNTIQKFIHFKNDMNIININNNNYYYYLFIKIGFIELSNVKFN